MHAICMKRNTGREGVMKVVHVYIYIFYIYRKHWGEKCCSNDKVPVFGPSKVINQCENLLVKAKINVGVHISYIISALAHCSTHISTFQYNIMSASLHSRMYLNYILLINQYYY